MTVHLSSSTEALQLLEEVRSRAARAARTAAAAAAAVDAEERFPSESLEAFRTEQLLSMMIPRALGGEGASAREVAEVCRRLGGACASSAMIFAMHQIALGCVIRHAGGGAWPASFLRRVAREQLLLASSTTEGTRGGEVRASDAAVQLHGEDFVLERDASVMSYGEQADAVVTTARRSPEASPTDQVLLVLTREDYALQRTRGWETLGMRGTQSAGFALQARAGREQILPAPYAEVHAQTMTPLAHLFWSSLWAGIAGAATERARLRLRAGARAARAAGREAPHGLAAFLKARSALDRLHALIAAALCAFEAVEDDPPALGAISYQTQITLLKVEASELAQECVLHALRACGLSGYRRDGEASVERHVRDILSAPLMIANERILADVGMGAILAAPSDDPFGDVR